MPRPDLGRRNLVARLSPEEMRPIDELAARLPPLRRGVPNRSEALRRIVAEWAAGQGRSSGGDAPCVVPLA